MRGVATFTEDEQLGEIVGRPGGKELVQHFEITLLRTELQAPAHRRIVFARCAPGG